MFFCLQEFLTFYQKSLRTTNASGEAVESLPVDGTVFLAAGEMCSVETPEELPPICQLCDQCVCVCETTVSFPHTLVVWSTASVCCSAGSKKAFLWCVPCHLIVPGKNNGGLMIPSEGPVEVVRASEWVIHQVHSE